MTLCDPMDCSLPGSSVYDILQARILKWVTILFSRESSQPRDQTRSPVLQVDSLPSEPAGKPIGIFIKLWILGKLELLWYLHLEHLYVKSVMPCQLYNQIKFLSIYLEAFFFQKDVLFFFCFVLFFMIRSCRTGTTWRDFFLCCWTQCRWQGIGLWLSQSQSIKAISIAIQLYQTAWVMTLDDFSWNT